MKSDLYTKAILTVIALALLVIALQLTIPSAFAQNNGIIKVAICDPNHPNSCAGIYSSKYGKVSGFITFVPGNHDQGFATRTQSQAIPSYQVMETLA